MFGFRGCKNGPKLDENGTDFGWPGQILGKKIDFFLFAQATAWMEPTQTKTEGGPSLRLPAQRRCPKTEGGCLGCGQGAVKASAASGARQPQRGFPDDSGADRPACAARTESAVQCAATVTSGVRSGVRGCCAVPETPTTSFFFKKAEWI